MTNSEKIQLITLRLRALEKETETLQLLEDTMKLMRLFARHEPKLVEIKRLVAEARTAYQEELVARRTTGSFVNYFARKNAVAALRNRKQNLYGSHKVANIDIEAIRAKIDELESIIGFDREDGVLMFNTMAKRWASGAQLPEAAVVRAADREDYEKVRIGRHIYILRSLSGMTEREIREFHLTILRYLRRLIQTEAGRNLILALDAGVTSLKRKERDKEMLVEIQLGQRAEDWACGSLDPNGASGLGKPTIDSIPKRRGERPGKQRGTGRGSMCWVTTYPAEVIQIGPGKGHEDNVWIPQHVALYHELTHALHSVTGTQDNTYLSERPFDLGDTFAHGYWYTKEEKATVAAEKEYSEQTGFNLKRLNYGSLGGRIDKS